MRLLRSIRACIARCTLLHVRTHVLWFGQYLQVIWQIITKHQSGWLAQILFQVSEIAAILGVAHPPRYSRAVKPQRAGEVSNGDWFAVRVLPQPLYGLNSLSDGLGHSDLYALGEEVCHQLPDCCIIFLYGGDDAPLGIPNAAGLMQKGVGTDEVQQRPEVAPEPDRHRRYECSQLPGVGYRDAMLSTFQPNVEGMPGREVRGSFACFLGQCRHDCTGLILGVRNGKGEKSGFVLRVEFDGGGGYDEARWALPFYEAWLHALRGLLNGLVADTPLREQRAHEIGSELPAHTGCLVDDQEAVFDGLLGVGEGAFAHGRERVVGALRDEGEHTLHQVALTPARGTFEGDADRP